MNFIKAGMRVINLDLLTQARRDENGLELSFGGDSRVLIQGKSADPLWAYIQAQAKDIVVPVAAVL
jgi:hypothetical protein